MQGGRRTLAAILALAIGGAVVLGLALSYVVILAPTVTVTAYYYEWSTPPSSLCDGWSSNTPAVPISLAAGARFTLSWTNGCWNDTGSYTITGIAALTPGFDVVSSNLPVSVRSTNVWFLNVTLSSPHTYFYGDVAMEIVAHPG